MNDLATIGSVRDICSIFEKKMENFWTSEFKRDSDGHKGNNVFKWIMV